MSRLGSQESLDGHKSRSDSVEEGKICFDVSSLFNKNKHAKPGIQKPGSWAYIKLIIRERFETGLVPFL